MVEALKLVGIVAFAVSGAMMAARKRMDVFGFVVLGVVTGIGGGALRDVLLGVRPPSWLARPTDLLLAAGAAALTFFFVPTIQRHSRALLWADAVGLAASTVVGTDRAISAGVPGAPAVVAGVMTACFGGVMRDVLAGEVPLIFRRELYAVPSILGASAYLLLDRLGVGEAAKGAISGTATFVARGLALRYGWSLPIYGKESP